MASTILVVDDDPHIREVVQFALKKKGFSVILSDNGKAGLESFRERNPDLVVLDILMPEMDGIETCRQIRAESETPIIFLTSVDDEIDRILGLELGADDYVTKPFSPSELVARIKAVLRRSARPEKPSHAEDAIVTHGPLRVDNQRFRAFWNDKEVSLTVTEFRLLQALLSFPGKVYSRDELMDRAYPDGQIVTDRTIDGHVKRIRRKFDEVGGCPIETVHGMGYRISEIEESQ